MPTDTDHPLHPLADAGPVIAPEVLVDLLGRDDVVVAEVAADRDERPYASGHVPGALDWYWRDMAWDVHDREFPSPEEMARRLGVQGVGDGVHLVMYSHRVQYAVYLWWVMVELCGFTDVHVVDGGGVAWAALGLPTEVGPVSPVARERSVPTRGRRDSSRVSRDELLRRIPDDAPRIVDARTDEEYSGARVKPGKGFDHGATRHGRIPGARSLMYLRLLDEQHRIRPVDELAALFAEVGADPASSDDVVAYCRMGHRGSLVWFITTQILGWDHVRLYDGSWTEWGSLVGAPVEGPDVAASTSSGAGGTPAT